MQSRAPWFEQRKSVKPMGDSKDIVRESPRRVVGIISSWHMVVWVSGRKKQKQTWQPRPMSKRWEDEFEAMFRLWR